ncbi:MAG: outer membrane protein assembly factor BamA [Candidatus Coatesbacteria bacterium]|nr:MAG: outer membrane protein assembly factor BamA [Candidatus Coatesbacteria bacterium]
MRNCYIIVLAVGVAGPGLFLAGYVGAQGGGVIVDDVRFEGLTSISDAAVETAIRLTPGLAITETELKTIVRDDIKRIYRLGYFERVDAFYEETSPGRVDVIFVIEERPRVKEVVFEGRRKMKRKTIEEIITVEAGERLSFSRLNADVEAMKELYFEKGYRFADISYRLEEEAGGIKVVYVITEGPKAVVRNIVIEGNDVLSDWHILNKVMKTKVDRFYNTKILDEEVLEEDFGRIEEEYANRGYVRARVVDHKVDYRKKRSAIYVTVIVEEGKLYRTGELRFAGNEKYDDERLRDRVDWRPGKPFSAKKLAEGTDSVRSLYKNNGYLFALVEPAEEIDDEAAIVDATVRIDEDRPAHVRLIDVFGNDSTRDKVIRREMRLQPGDIYKENKLIRSIQRLHNLGYFDEILPDIRIADRDAGLVDLEIGVVEKMNTAKVNFGAGYSTLDGLVGTFSLAWANFDASRLPYIWRCKGAGQELRLSTEFGRRRTQYSVGFTEPYMFDTKTLGAVDFYNIARLRPYYDEKRFGGNVTVGRPLSEYVRGRTKYKFESVEVVSTVSDPGRVPWVAREIGRRNTSAVTMAVERDSRDNVFFPQAGSDSEIAAEVAGSVFGGDVDFWRVTMGPSWYFKHFWETVLAIRARGGYVESYGRTRTVPVYERFYLGGANTVRGYDEWEVGPRDVYGNPEGGKSMFYTNFEYRIPISKDFFHFIMFWDSGYCWRELRDINLQDMQSGVGAGVRINIPMMGLLGIDYGYGLDARSGQIHFNIGSTF